MNNELFSEKSNQIHNGKYDTSKVNYVNYDTKVCLICPIHGEFWQAPRSHLKGCGCPKCAAERLSKELSMGINEFIRRAKEIHGNKFDYSKVVYLNANTKVCIIDEYGNEFWQTPASHLKGCGNKAFALKKAWSKRKRVTTETIIKRAKELYGNKYIYDKINFVNFKTKICVICPIHGEFMISPSNFLSGKGCYKCGRKNSALKQSLNNEDFIAKAKKIHGDKYNYSKVDYINNRTKVCIIDNIYGEFWQTPASHLKGCGHPNERYEKVWNKRGRVTTEQFVKKARAVHGDKYDYSKVNYVNSATKVCIICPKHGEFWQTPESHLQGKGCSLCSMSHLENEIMCYLQDKKIEFIYNCNKDNLPWIKRQHLDFYIPKYNTAIECQGSQHFIASSFGSKDKTPESCLKSIIERDKRKAKLCKKNGVRLLYYSNLEIKYPYFVYENKEELIKALLNG